MNTLEQFYIQKAYGEDTLIPEQHAGEENQLFMLINKTKPKEKDRKDNSTPKEHIT
jgi:hypothetical protein